MKGVTVVESKERLRSSRSLFENIAETFISNMRLEQKKKIKETHKNGTLWLIARDYDTSRSDQKFPRRIRWMNL